MAGSSRKRGSTFRVLTYGLNGLALVLVVLALMCASAPEAQAGPYAQCVCDVDSCALLPGGGCCNGFCRCDDNCGCKPYTDPDTGAKFANCQEV
jgi:hypothetical protein